MDWAMDYALELEHRRLDAEFTPEKTPKEASRTVVAFPVNRQSSAQFTRQRRADERHRTRRQLIHM